MTDSMDLPPGRFRYRPPEIDTNPECVAAWAALIEEEGYPMTCTGVVAQGYFSAGWRAARAKRLTNKPPTKVPE